MEQNIAKRIFKIETDGNPCNVIGGIKKIRVEKPRVVKGSGRGEMLRGEIC